MVNIKTVITSLYVLPTSPLLCVHAGIVEDEETSVTCDLKAFKGLILLLIAWCNPVSAVRKTL